MHHAHLPVFHETLSRRGIIADITEHSAAARSLMGVEVDVGLEDGVGWGRVWDAGKGGVVGGHVQQSALSRAHAQAAFSSILI